MVSSFIASVVSSLWKDETYRLVIARDIEDRSLFEAANRILEQEFGDRHQVCPQGSFLLVDEEQRIVAGHVRLTYRDGSFTSERAQRMLKAGIPRPVVEQAALGAGLSSLEELLDSASAITPSSPSCLIDALVVRPELRGRGLGKATAKAAVALAIQIWGVQQITALAATPQLVAWYERMGAKRDVDAVVGKKAKQKQRAIVVNVEHLKGGSLQVNLTKLGVPNHVQVILPSSLTN